VIEELQAEDEDGHSLEEPCVWQEDEIQADHSEEEEVDGALEELEEHFPDILAQMRANREKQPAGNIVAQFQRLEDVDGRRRKKKN
jgi:hypothetical protein